MFTEKYRGMYVHGHFDKTAVWVNYLSGEIFGRFKSMRAAKSAITKHIHEAYGYNSETTIMLKKRG